ncbi:MAG: ABC transporter permease, partial [Wujia sp.]
MLKNNNQVAVNRIYQRMLKQNKIRNRIVILAIILTTFMFTAVFTLGFSMAKNLNQMQLRLQGSKASIYLEHPSEEQLESAKECKNLHAAGVQIDAEAVSDATGDYEFLLQYYDKTEFQNNLTPAIDAIQGAYPEKENEIMVAKNTLEALGITEPELHQTVSLYMNGEKTEFVLSGWFNYFGRKNLCLVSKAYVDKQGYRMEDCGRISMSAKEGKQEALRDELEKQVKLRAGQDFDVTYDVQEENSGNRIVIAVCICLIALMIVLSGYLLIYNVMYISVTKDIRFYGMLKTIGTAPSQIQTIVKRQAKHLAWIGIPIGVVLGTGVSFGVVPLAMRMLSIDREAALSSAVSFNPGIYIFSIAFAFMTVLISAKKPAKLAGRVSAIDAMKYNGSERIRPHKTTSGGKLSRMAWRNVFREKKRSMLVFASMFMGTMTFLCVNTFIKCLDSDSFIEHYLHNDYVLYGGNDEEHMQSKKTMEDIAQEMREIPGMGTVYTNRSEPVTLPF